MATTCEKCPLRRIPLFLPMTADELSTTQEMKLREDDIPAGRELIAEGEASPWLYTVLSGMGLRHKTLPDGRRQVINIVMPGDFIGLQAGVMGEMRHAVEATTRMRLCVFRREDLWRLFQKSPARAFDVTYLAAMEEHMLGDALMRLGQQGARARIAWCLYRIHARALEMGLCFNDGSCALPYRQQDLADALGLSLVHTNKTLARLREEGVAEWKGGRLSVFDADRLAELGQVERREAECRPLI